MHNIDSLDKLPVGQTAPRGRASPQRQHPKANAGHRPDRRHSCGMPAKKPFRRSCGLFDPRRRHRSTPGGFRPRHGAFQLTFPCAPP